MEISCRKTAYAKAFAHNSNGFYYKKHKIMGGAVNEHDQ